MTILTTCTTCTTEIPLPSTNHVATVVIKTCLQERNLGDYVEAYVTVRLPIESPGEGPKIHLLPPELVFGIRVEVLGAPLNAGWGTFNDPHRVKTDKSPANYRTHKSAREGGLKWVREQLGPLLAALEARHEFEAGVGI